jgi:capsid protein
MSFLEKLSAIGRRLGRVFQEDPAPVEASYDNARSDGQAPQHWIGADALDADSCNSLAVRARLTRNSRYETGNNGQAKGVQLTQANYVVGRGPTLRMETDDVQHNQAVEAAWTRWSKRVRLARKLRTAVKAKVTDGEGFLVAIDNPVLADPVKLDLRGIECEQCTSPMLPFNEPQRVDGIKFDEWGNPLIYEILKYHPGGQWASLSPTPDQVPARFVFHLFREDRAGQHRAVPEVTPTLNLFGSGRRYREATVQAAENIANFSILLKTQATANIEPQRARPFSTLPMEKGMYVQMPFGQDLYQPRAEQPAATYEEFTRSLACEQARPLNMPYNIAAADSSGYSFSGGRLDHLTYFVSVDVEQADLEDLVLDPLFELWYVEAAPVYGWIERETPAHSWRWPKKPSIDDEKTANARKTELSTGVKHRRRIADEDNVDLDDEDRVAAADVGLTVREYRRRIFEANLAAGKAAAPNPSDGQDAKDAQEMPPPRNGAAARRAGSNGNGRVRV